MLAAHWEQRHPYLSSQAHTAGTYSGTVHAMLLSMLCVARAQPRTLTLKCCFRCNDQAKPAIARDNRVQHGR
jgi:hypothetical protein